jgi:hypothetical protein
MIRRPRCAFGIAIRAFSTAQDLFRPIGQCFFDRKPIANVTEHDQLFVFTTQHGYEFSSNALKLRSRARAQFPEQPSIPLAQPRMRTLVVRSIVKQATSLLLDARARLHQSTCCVASFVPPLGAGSARRPQPLRTQKRAKIALF